MKILLPRHYEIAQTNVAKKLGRIHGNPVADGWSGAVMQQVAQGQYVVSDTRCPALHGCKSE